MERTVVFPDTKEDWLKLRKLNLNSTEISALFGISPYMTEYELYHIKTGQLSDYIDENERMLWGTRLQEGIAKGVSEDLNQKLRPMPEYVYIPELRLGSSFDYELNGDTILEIKNVDFLEYRDKWIDDGIDLEAPAHIELQVQHQMLVSLKTKAVIAALVGGNKCIIIHREFRPDIAKAIIKKSMDFWERVDKRIAPEPNFEKDSSVVAKMFNSYDEGSVLNADENITMLALEYKAMGEAEKLASSKKEQAKAKLLMAMGHAQKARGLDFTISTSMIQESEVSYKREAYRSFRINWKKEK